MSLNRVIIHIDVNSFFASVEKANNPKLRNKPIIVGGHPEFPTKGVVGACCYEAKKFGIKAATPMFQATKLCPHAVIICPNHHEYSTTAIKFFNYLRKNYTEALEVFSIDECYLDVTNIWKKYGSVQTLAYDIQKNVLRDLCLPCSIGVSFNRYIAKIASDIKKPLGITMIKDENDIKKIIYPLSAGAIIGVGKKTQELIDYAQIKSIEELFNKKRHISDNILGKKRMKELEFELSSKCYVGISLKNNFPKSISRSSTLNKRYTNDEIINHLQEMAIDVFNRSQKNLLLGRTVHVKIRNRHFYDKSKQKTFSKNIQTFDEFWKIVFSLTKEWIEKDGIDIRLIGCTLCNLTFCYRNNEYLTENASNTKVIQINETINKLNNKFKNEPFFNGLEYMALKNIRWI
ncbi:hypothetical protein ASO20_00050 [Mycoplasma sp. (ex Biomphalaria glabrata)]|uniref:Y-family DNA polymerase n=1 Tax=Mycoplasma sp. (ex Biomphalaria glabrata) TaxID=1749074 RepID=UPI00073ACD12|nr:DNA polymerase IV [Mycoplasma sp. (ex Biomphalaria glabrata)]ALV23072.1 hypothetical protein ASO20_00050 [Mycoplasma sp. (ex Biomphalaria glabrata)]